MTRAQEAHHRRSIRLQGYDYTQAGAYFVTLVTYERTCWLGHPVGNGIRLSPAGQVAYGEWLRLEKRFPGVMVDEFTIMPNHIHGTLFLPDRAVRPDSSGILPAVGARSDSGGMSPAVGARQENDSRTGNNLLASPLQTPLPVASPLQGTHSPPSRVPHGPPHGALGTIIGAYKSTTARLINGINRTPGAPLWQRNYYEHIIRSVEELARIRIYIRDNPHRWAEDKDYL